MTETNIFPLQIDFENFQISRTPFSEEKLAQLRNDYNHTHSFFRKGDFIYISNKDGDENLNLGEVVDVSTDKDSDITLSLIKHTFFRTFKDRHPNITPTDFYPFRIYSSQQKDDLISEFLPANLKGSVSYKKQIEIQLRYLQNGDKKFYGFVIGIYRRWLLNKTCLELHTEGYKLVGSEVLHCEVLPGMQNILAPNDEFVGVVKSVNVFNAIVQTNEGDKEIPLSELSLRKTRSSIQNYLAHAISEDAAEKIFNNLEKKKPEILNAKNERNEIKSVAEFLSNQKDAQGIKSPILYQNKDGFCFTVSSNPYSAENAFTLKKPTFIFDPAANKTNAINPDIGLTTFGPYDSLIFDIKTPYIVGICLKENRGSFSTFLANLFDGMPNSKYFQKGFKKKYDLLKVEHNILEIAKYDYDEYNRVIQGFDSKPDLVVIEIPEAYKLLSEKDNPYYRLKARLLTLEIPFQFILNRKVKSHDEYLLNSIALQMYAKLGGTPWVLPSNRSVDREIVIGIGHSIIRQNIFSGANQNRVVGITSFFSSDGQYLLSNKAKDVPYEQYFTELLTNLNDSFNKLEQEQAWKEGDTIRLIFHIFKPIRNVEFEVVSELIKRFSKFKIQFAFVTISKKHPHLLFDPNQKGVQYWFSGKQKLKGELVPDRGTVVMLDANSCLIQMLGAKEIKTDRHGASNPMLIRVRVPQGNFDTSSIEELLFTDLQYISQQIFSFTYLSWRSFLPGEEPATILYSNLIARLLGKLRKIEGWQPDVLNYNLKRKKWFL